MPSGFTSYLTILLRKEESMAKPIQYCKVKKKEREREITQEKKRLGSKKKKKKRKVNGPTPFKCFFYFFNSLTVLYLM